MFEPVGFDRLVGGLGTTRITEGLFDERGAVWLLGRLRPLGCVSGSVVLINLRVHLLPEGPP